MSNEKDKEDIDKGIDVVVRKCFGFFLYLLVSTAARNATIRKVRFDQFSFDNKKK